MKIFKYILIILALSLVFLSVYIATGKSEYELTVTEKTELSNQRIYRYVNNLQNFDEWNPWYSNEEVFKLDSISKGKNAKVQWNGNQAIITSTALNDSLALTLDVSGNVYDTKMYFNEVAGKTTITWKINGNLSFSEKFQIFFS